MITARLKDLRNEMRKQGADAYIIPLCDPHQSEYPATHWKIVPWISGFSGSAGTLMVTQDHAGLWTDSRYYLQAEQEFADNPFVLHKMKMQGHPGFIDWCRENMCKGSKVVVDGPLITLAQKDRYATLLDAKGIEFKTSEDLVSPIWSDRPPIPEGSVFEHPVKFSGKSRADKLSEVKAALAEKGANNHLITTLDDIAWLLNLRGGDVAFNPVFVAYCAFSGDQVFLFINPAKVPDAVRTALEADGVTLKPYTEVVDYLKNLGTDSSLLIDKSTLNVQLYEAIGSEVNIINNRLLTRYMKAVKNETEIDHLRKVHVKDAVALTEAFHWLENTVKERTVTEYELAAKLAECRSKQADYFGESFSAIVGYKGNGAIIHYRPELDTAAEITDDGILLVDSGGQYFDGTTDITRTITFTAPPPEQKNAYTRVLKGHIALALAKFPEGTKGGQLDLLARKSLWDDGLNYGHGTGHGVGFFLNVHEPPQGFAPGTTGRAASVQEVGMITSNEPGHYVTDQYGIRIENLLLTKHSDKKGFLEFETITYFPIDTQLIDFSLLRKDEIEWINAYHQDVKERVCPHLKGELLAWMENKCAKV